MVEFYQQEIIDQLIKHGIDPEQVKHLHLQLKLGEINSSSFLAKEKLSVPSDDAFYHYDEKFAKLGQAAIKRGELLMFWLNGGAATRYFDESKITPDEKKRFAKELIQDKDLPKGITPVFNGMTYLELKIKNLLKITKELHLTQHPQVLIMNSFLTDKETKKHLQELFHKYPQLITERFHFIVQRPRLPRFKKVDEISQTDLFIDQKGHLSFAPAGHGDFLYLTKEYFQEEKIKGARYMFFSNIDNFGSYIDPAILGFHIQSGKSRTVEVALKNKGDKGGAPCLVDNKLQIVEQMKFPADFDQDQLKYFNTNNFWFTLKDLLAYEEELPLVAVDKKITSGEVVQLERFACDVDLPSNFLIVKRAQRFWPIKRYVDLLIYLYPEKNNKKEQQQAEQFQELLKLHFL